MKNWKKWLSAGLLAAVLGAAGISAPATVSANAGYLPYDRIDNLAPEETMARVRAFFRFYRRRSSQSLEEN